MNKIKFKTFDLLKRTIYPIMAVLLLSNMVFSQDASCGELQRSHDIDSDRDGTIDRTVVFDKCVLREFQYDGNDKKIVVHYTLTNGSSADRLRSVDSDGDGVTDITGDEIAEAIAEFTQEAWEKYLDYGNPDPMGRRDMNVYVYDMRSGLGGWCCGSDHYEIDAPVAVGDMGSDSRNLMSTCYHEMWHASRYNGFGGWITEGSASNMGDHVNLSVDNDDSNDYIGKVNGYLRSDYRSQISTISYTAALWWKYFMERVGTNTPEPERGVDAMTKFWDNTASDGFTTFDDVIEANLSGENLQSIWLDFTVANYAKEFTGIPDKYKYIDESQSGAPDYPTPGSLDLDVIVNTTDGGVTRISDIQPWSSRYFKIRPTTDVPLLNFEFRQDTDNILAYTLLLIKEGAVVKEVQSKTREFVHTEINNDFDEAVVCVTAFSKFANFRYTINGVDPIINIISPLRSQPAIAGDPSAPDKILVKAEALSPIGGGTPLEGLTTADFEIRVGGLLVPQTAIIASTYLQGQYWFVLRPSAQPSNGLKDLEIAITGLAISDSERNAVDFNPLGNFDNIIIGDRSGSMGDFNKLIAAQDAARLYIESWKNGDKVGVVSFNSDPSVDLSLRDWNNTSRGLAFDEINDWMHGGGTAIGDGLLSGLDELKNRGDGSHDWAMIVLSDGKETADKRISEFLTEFKARQDNGKKNPAVHTVALGPDSERANMQNLANETGGTYHFAAEPSAISSALALTANASFSFPNNINNELAEIYRIISEEITVKQQIYSEFGSLSSSEPEEHLIEIDPGASEAIFSVNWYPNAPDSLLLVDPNDNIIVPTSTDKSHTIFKVNAPTPGTWKIQLSCKTIIILSTINSGFSCSDYLVEAALKSQLTADLFFGLSVDKRNVGQKMPIIVALTDEKPIVNANVNATVTEPDKLKYTIKLYDDGNHNDGNSNDGVYGNLIHRTSKEGSYVVKVDISGNSNTGSSFTRKLSEAFNMKKSKDSDGDGMPDEWEVSTGLDPTTKDDTLDSDADGITNINEFELGLNPNDSDSDDGGEEDGSEVDNGSDPLDPKDDQIPCILDFYTTNYLTERGHGDYQNLKAAILKFSVDPSYDHFIISRATDAKGVWTVIENKATPSGTYVDTNVAIGQTYYYKIQAVNNVGRKSCILGPRETTPKEDPIPPEGFLIINNGAETTQSLDVKLTIESTSDATQMRISNTGDFRKVNWIPFDETVDWKLDSSTPDGSSTWVYVELKDASENISEILNDGIKYEPKKNYWCLIFIGILILLLILIVIIILNKRNR